MASVTRKVVACHSLHGVNYEDYVRYRDTPQNRHLRMTYQDGCLQLMSPELAHERPSERLSMIIRATAAVFDIDCEGTGSTTFRKGQPGTHFGQGKEADRSFYIANEPAIRQKDQ